MTCKRVKWGYGQKYDAVWSVLASRGQAAFLETLRGETKIYRANFFGCSLCSSHRFCVIYCQREGQDG